MSKSYHVLSLEHAEEAEDYRPSGFHPVHFGDVYDGRYQVIHKLGFGGYSTTWLARDRMEARYVALKINKASESATGVELRTYQRLAKIESDHPGQAHLRGLLASFTITGPNGIHDCLVTEVAGPSLVSLCETVKPGYARRLRAPIARSIAKQVTQAVCFLHENQIGHGDLTASNILLKLQPLDGLTEDEIYERFGRPRKETLLMESNKTPGASAPRYIVESATVPSQQYLTRDIFLIDLGVSFPFEQPPRPEDIGVPLIYRAPETMFDSRYDQFSDSWALGCLLFEIRASTPLFSQVMGTEEEIIRQWVQTKGKPPEPWWSHWEARCSYFDDAGKPLPDGPDGEAMASEYPLGEMIADIGEEDGEVESDDERTVELAETQSMFETPGMKVPDEEALMLEDLLSKILQWDPQARLTAEQILQHPWMASV